MTQNRLLIANRGEIALRIIRSAKEMGLHTIAVYSDVDADSLHVKRADESYYLGGSLPAESYRNIKNLMKAVVETNADLVHPGYGFLSENAIFAKRCQEAGIVFIGPSPNAIELMGDKMKARALVQERGIPFPPGLVEPIHPKDNIEKIANEIGVRCTALS